MAQRLYTTYIWTIVGPVMLVATLAFGLLCLLLAPVLGPRRTGQLTAVPWARLGLLLSGVRVNTDGHEQVIPGQSYVVVANHLSLVDIWVLYGYLGLDIRWVAKQELRQVPVIGVACVALGHVFIDRSNHERAVATLESAKRRITGGTSIIFFPEGTRSRSGELQPFKKGAFRMARDMELPVLPVTLSGTRDILAPGSMRARHGSVQLRIHAPLPVADQSVDALMAQSRRAIQNGLDAQPASQTSPA